MQEAMQKYASVYKSKELLESGFEIIEKLANKKITIRDHSLIWNTDLTEALEFRNMISLAYITISASLFREESRGSHYRYDFPERKRRVDVYTLSFLDTKNNVLTNEKSDVNFIGLYTKK